MSQASENLIALTPAMFLREQVECGLPDCDAIDTLLLNHKLRKMHVLRCELQRPFRVEYLSKVCMGFQHDGEPEISNENNAPDCEIAEV